MSMLFTNYGQSQSNQNLSTAVEYMSNHLDKYDLTKEDLEGYTVSSMRTSDRGVTYIYLTQTANGIEIRNAMLTIILNQQGKVAVATSTFIKEAVKKVTSLSPSITEIDAIKASAKQLGHEVHSIKPEAERNDVKTSSFLVPELAKTPIVVQKMYEYTDGKLVLVFNLKINMVDNSDYWDYNVDASTGDFISKLNYTVYCTHHKENFVHHDCDINRVQTSFEESIDNKLNLGAGVASYKVYKLPTESPLYGGLETAHDNLYPTSSPFGWHDTNGIEGAEYTITRGNNVFAYEDKDDDNSSDGNEPDGGASLNFDFPVDLAQDPRQSNQAAVTNLFYLVNMMHDVTALLGFDEAAGNFQSKNYTGIFGEGDYVLAQAFDGITKYENNTDLVNGNHTKINNANFSTPPDGINGVMQMFLWTNDSGAISIDEPASIKEFVQEYGSAGFGMPYPKENEPPVTGECIITRDNTLTGTTCCNTILDPANVKGKIAIIDRGSCDFSRKVYRAQQAGAIAAVICNIPGVNGGNGEELVNMGGADDAQNVTIPSVFFKKSLCDKIKMVLNEGTSVVITFQERAKQGADYLDGALDNGIIAHEFGHGISNRLTGGPGNTSCLGNDEQMGEGWSDFFGLIMTRRPNDLGAQPRGMGNFAAAQQINGGGLRRFPYSTDFNINSQTYDDIKGTTAPHPLGEVWADILWDIYWKFIDLYGYDPDWTNKESGNYKAVFLVMEGMAMQNCNPGFVNGRDGILNADLVHFDGQHNCMLWEVFARRGVGKFANQGSSNNRNDGIQNFDVLPTCIEALKISKAYANSEGNPGDVIDVELNAINHILGANNDDILITDVLQDGLTYVAGSAPIEPEVNGNELVFNIGKLAYDTPYKLNYQLKSSTANTSTLVKSEDFEGDLQWDLEAVGGNTWFTDNEVYRSPQTSIVIYSLPLEMDASIISSEIEINKIDDAHFPVMRFWHKYNIELINDGGFLEISVDGGPFNPVPKELFLKNGYTGQLAYSTLAVPSLYAFSGKSGSDWIDSYLDLSPYVGKKIKIAFRYGSNDSIAPEDDLPGWYIDDLDIFQVYKYDTKVCIEAKSKPETKQCGPNVTYFINPNQESSVKDDNNIFTLTVFPNPVSEVINVAIKSPIQSDATLELINASGQKITSSNIQVGTQKTLVSLDAKSLQKGIYILKIQSGKFITSKKIVVI